MDTRIADSLIARRSPAVLAGIVSGVALLLAAVGTYGVLSYTIAQRRREIGVRMALGAQSSDILGMVMRRCLWLTVAGLMPGIALAYAAGRSMQALLAGVEPTDAPTLAGAVTLVVVMMVIGSVMPLMSISWKASFPMSTEGTLPVIATIGTESSSAVPIPVTRFVAPGPLVAMHTPTRPVAVA